MKLMSIRSDLKRHKTVGVKIGDVMVGGHSPVVVQSMTNTLEHWQKTVLQSWSGKDYVKN